MLVKGAGYLAAYPPRVEISVATTASCIVLPHGKATVINGKVDSISITGGLGCTALPTIKIAPPEVIPMKSEPQSSDPQILIPGGTN